MFNLLVYILLVPLAVFVAGQYVSRKLKFKSNAWLLTLACALFAVAVLIPSPLVHGQQTQFLTHVIGGIFVGLLWLYFRPKFGPRPWYWELLILYVLTSSFGVLNELYEIFAHEVGLWNLPLTDTSWDLLANTLGVALFYGIYLLTLMLRTLFIRR